MLRSSQSFGPKWTIIEINMPRIKLGGTAPTVSAETPVVGEIDLKKKVEKTKPAEKVSSGRDPRFPVEQTTNEDLMDKSGSPVMAAFSAFPKKVHFSGQQNDEDIILLIRAHPITNFPWILLAILGIIAPVILGPLLFLSGTLPPIGFGLGLSVAILWYLGIFTYSFLNLLYWYFNVGLVTNERVIDIDWNSLVDRDVATAQVSQIEDIREAQIGVLPGVFDFGNVYIQTAGTQPNVEFYNVPHPQLIVRKIQELMQREELEWEENPT